jgi:prepilin-type N-terminal cleavage/methylation domain-containing protein
MSRGAALRPSTSGFTLIELVVVLFIVVAVAAVAMPSIGRGVDGLRLRREASQVAALIRTARLRALTEQRPVRVTLDPAHGTVILAAGAAGARGREVVLPPGVSARVDAGGSALTFSPRGVARPVRWVLEDTRGRRFAVEVADVGARVRVAADRAP